MAISKLTACQFETQYGSSVNMDKKASKQGGKVLCNNLLEGGSFKSVNFVAFIKCLQRKMNSLEG